MPDKNNQRTTQGYKVKNKNERFYFLPRPEVLRESKGLHYNIIHNAYYYRQRIRRASGHFRIS
jgi:hypothetical protein